MTGDFRRGMGYGLTLGSVAVGLAVALTLYCLDADACGTEDWPQKTLTDGSGLANLMRVLGPADDAGFVLRTEPIPVAMSVWALRQMEPLNLNHVLVSVDAYVLGFKLEADEDFHVVISDAPEWKSTMIAELPAPHCTTGSPYSAQMSKARADFVALFGIPTKKVKRLKVPVRVRLTGVVYFDFIHGQLGVAPNGVELHPLLSIEALP